MLSLLHLCMHMILPYLVLDLSIFGALHHSYTEQCNALCTVKSAKLMFTYSGFRILLASTLVRDKDTDMPQVVQDYRGLPRVF